MLIGAMIPIRNINPPSIEHINDVAISDELKSRPLDIKFIIKTPKIIISIAVPKSPPEPPQPEEIQKILLSI